MAQKNIPLALAYDDVLLVPQHSTILPTQTDLSTSLSRLPLALPLISAPMDTVTEYDMSATMAAAGGLGIVHKNMSAAAQAGIIRRLTKQKLVAGAAVGVSDEHAERATECVAAGVRVIVVDSAHGHSQGVLKQVARLKKTLGKKTILVGGNVATAAGVRALVRAGADVVKVGVGPGSICTTRVVAGIGIPQFTAVQECVREAQKTHTPIIADGGIKYSGDIVKALAAGAVAVMCGGLFAATAEAPGKIVTINGVKMKVYRGMGSLPAMQAGSKDRYGQVNIKNKGKLVPEGIVGYQPYKGSVRTIIDQLAGGIRSGLGYCGAINLVALRRTAQFVRITNAGLRESHPHSLKIIEPTINYHQTCD